MENLFNLVFPPNCLFCGRAGKMVCNECLLKCKPLNCDYCVVCDKSSDSGITHKICANSHVPTQCLSVFEYDGIVRDCIRESKYRRKQFAALKCLALAAAIMMKNQDQDGYFTGFVVTPVPVSKRKERMRGFNQALIIAKVLSKQFSLPCQDSILVRQKDTIAQYERTRQQRFDNVVGAFGVRNGSKVQGLKILLVDDICTTGATLLEASKVLYGAGAAEVKCFALSKKPSPTIIQAENHGFSRG